MRKLLVILITIPLLFSNCEEEDSAPEATPPPSSSACLSITVDGVTKNINPPSNATGGPCGLANLSNPNGNITSFILTFTSLCSNNNQDYQFTLTFSEGNTLPNGLQVGTQYSSTLTVLINDPSVIEPWSLVNFQDFGCGTTVSTYGNAYGTPLLVPQTFQITNIDYTNNLISGEVTSLVSESGTSNTVTMECTFTAVPFN